MLPRSVRTALCVGLLVLPIAVIAACESDESDAGVTPQLPDGGGAVDVDGAWTSPDGAAVDAASDASVVGPSDVVQIAAGNYHACARRGSGQVTCWGHNSFGALGTGQKTEDNVLNLPQAVIGLDDAVHISAGHHRTCAARATGTVACWGSFGGISNGATSDVLAPTTIVTSLDAGTPLTGVAEVGARWFGYSCARKSDNTVTCWAADNSTGRNGDGTTDGRTVPNVNVSGLTDAVELAKGESFACARRVGGAVVCWGFNTNGQLGTGATGAPSPVPLSVLGITDATALGVGQNQTCARHADGTVSCWGENNSGQLGNGEKKLNSPTPTLVSNLSDAKQLVGGASHFCALRETGSVVCWGSNAYGQLGDGTKEERLTPTPVSGLTDAVEVVAGWLFTCARRATGKVVCWGANDRGQHGDGTNTEHLTPNEIVGL